VKMYILIKDTVPLGMAVLAAAHASLKCYREFETTPEMKEWISGIFYKVVCEVTEQEFERAGMEPDHTVVTESRFGGAEVALALRPRQEWPEYFSFFRLYGKGRLQHGPSGQDIR